MRENYSDVRCSCRLATYSSPERSTLISSAKTESPTLPCWSRRITIRQSEMHPMRWSSARWQSSIERIHQKDKTLPSKFQAADRERLLQVVKAPGRGRALVTHLVAALNDALVLSL